MLCTKCGARMVLGQQFCPNCGNRAGSPGTAGVWDDLDGAVGERNHEGGEPLISKTDNASISRKRREKATNVFSKVDKAVVYRRGAYIFRRADIHLAKGKSTVCFVGVTDAVSAETIQVAMAKGVSCGQVGYDAKFQYEEEEPEKRQEPEEMKELKAKRDTVENCLAAAKTTLDMLSKNVGPDFRGNFSMELFREYVDYVQEKQNDLLEQVRVLEGERQEIDEELKKWEKECDGQEEKKLPCGAVWVDVTVQEEGEYPFELAYYTGKAHWTPFYDIHVDDTESPLAATLKGKINQWTGEAWENVALVLSTGNLGRSNNQPELPAWILRRRVHAPAAFARAVPNAPLPPASQKMASKAAAVNEDSQSLLEDTVNLEQWKPNVENIQDKYQTSTEYEIAGKYDVESDDGGTILDISENRLEAEYIYYITPKAECSAFFVAHVHEWEKGDFLEGDANIFLENRYVGSTHLTPQTMDKVFTISLGRDRSILVQRKMRRQYQSKNFLGSMFRKDFEYELRIRNGKDIPIQVVVKDQIPLSSDEKIRVEVEEISEGQLDEKTGELSWKRSLESTEELLLNISFRVSWPKEYEVEV